ncbi:MAG: hypothetical protein ACOZAO_00680 [Patescibacteria group bacterium]
MSTDGTDHNGWHAYRHIISEVNLIWYLDWYARPDENTTNYLITPKRRKQIVRIIEKKYKVKLKPEDKAWILEKMNSPRHLCTDFPNRFNPRHYPSLTSDLPPENKTK